MTTTLAALITEPERVATMPRHTIPEVLGELETLRARLLLRLSDVAAVPVAERLLTCQEVATQIDAPLPRVYELCRLGKLPHVKLGRQKRVAPAALREWIANGGQA